MFPVRAPLQAVGSALLAALVLVGCGDGEDRAQIAAAKCSLPVDQAAGFGEDTFPRRENITVTDLGKGSYRVTGTATVLDDGESESVEFLCEVVPDDSDTLRGFAVSRLEVTPTT